ncbi:hypothetical protein GBAR_LOCUS29380 [Geodia barretti]|uniref:Uncharacterized protein n=1 Tax=Geodia barretti TaxID=519541 RepID=A0AA35TU45_GEOBA|nr:hypothetical protein GBAR_LOCUS29380 [Geodia barretti]
MGSLRPLVLLELLSCTNVVLAQSSETGTIIVVVVPTLFAIIIIAIILTVVFVVICYSLRPLFRLRNNLATPTTVFPTTASTGSHPYAAAPVVLPPTVNNAPQHPNMPTSAAPECDVIHGPQAPPPSYKVAMGHPSYNC